MGKTASLAAIVAAILAAFALAACGGDDNGEDEDQITEAIEVSATSTDPNACTEFQTQSFVEQTSGEGETGEAAVQACREGQDEPVGQAVDISDIEIEDGNATAVVALTGGFIDGQSIELGLREEDGQWKLDELIGFAEFDRAAFVDTIVQGGAEEGGDQACLRQRIDSVSDEDLQAVFLENDETLFEQTLAPCFKGQEG